MNKLLTIIIPSYRSKILILSHIKKLSNKYKFKIIEDASHCVGAKYKKIPVGSCKYSDITVLSFHPVKIITTGEGGMVLTNNKLLNHKIKILRTSGINKNLSRKKFKKKGKWFYEQQMLGFNYRMNDIEASLGTSQLTKVRRFIKKRNSIAKRYINSFKYYPIQYQKVDGGSLSSYHLFIIRVNKFIRKKIFDKMRKFGFYVNIHYIPIHLQPYYKRLGFKKGMFPNAEKYYNEAISIPIYPNLTNKNQQKIINLLKANLK